MAKGNMLLGQARGSVGNVTFSRLYGKQISRAKATSVKNPKTDAQMVQRIIMNTTVQGYSGMQAIVDHSFQGVAYNGPSMNKFNSLNSRALRSRYATYVDEGKLCPRFNGNGNKRVSANQWIISTGSLPQVKPLYRSDIDPTEPNALGYMVAETANTNIEGLTVDYGLMLEIPVTGATAPTYAEFLAYYGLNAGDQLTLCALVRSHGDSDTGCSFKYARFILMPNDGDLSHPINETEYENPRNEGATFNLETGDTPHLSICFADLFGAGQNNRTYFESAGIITSRLEQNSWKRSNTQMDFCSDEAYTENEGLSMQAAIDSYSGAELNIESPWYLNKAQKSAGTGAEPITPTLTTLTYDTGGTQIYVLGYVDGDGTAYVIATALANERITYYNSNSVVQAETDLDTAISAGSSSSIDVDALAIPYIMSVDSKLSGLVFDGKSVEVTFQND